MSNHGNVTILIMACYLVVLFVLGFSFGKSVYLESGSPGARAGL